MLKQILPVTVVADGYEVVQIRVRPARDSIEHNVDPLRRRLTVAGAAGLLLTAYGTANAGPLDAFSNADATTALRRALEIGSAAAIGKLGIDGGFLNNPQVRIPLPDALRKVEGVLRAMGRGADLDALVAGMNRAAEQAVPQAKQLVTHAIKAMSVQDAKGILSGGNDSVTRFFREKTFAPLTEKFLPIVTATVGRIGLAQRYNDVAGQGVKLGLVEKDSATVQSYVTGKALDGLYMMIAQEEKAIRANPVQAGGDLLKRVFGALR